MKKRKKQVSHIPRSLKKLRESGAIVEKVERVVPYSFIKQDLFGFIDLLALFDGRTVGVQVTDMSHAAEHVKKIRASENFEPWLAAGNDVELWAWRKVGAFWQVKITNLVA